jgi:hypothetical protein
MWRAECQFRRSRIGAVAKTRLGGHDAVLPQGVKVDRHVARAGDAQKAEFGKPGDQTGWKRGSLAHRHDDVEIGQRLRGRILGRKRLIEERDRRMRFKRRPIRAFARRALPIVDYRNLGHLQPFLPDLTRPVWHNFYII